MNWLLSKSQCGSSIATTLDVFEVRGKRIGRVAIRAAHHVLVKLPEILEAGRLAEALKRGRTAAFARAVVEHGDLRSHRVGGRRRLAAVTRSLVDVDGANTILRTKQRDFVVPRKVAEVCEPEFAVLHDHTNRCAVFRIAVRALRDAVAVRVRHPLARDGLAERFDDEDVEPLDGNLVTGRDDDVFPFCEGRGPVLGVLTRLLLHRRCILQRRAVIDEGAHRQRQ